jgi:L-rhamnose mutarotase
MQKIEFMHRATNSSNEGAAIAKENIRDFNIDLTEIAGKRFLVSYFEYTGTNLEADFASIADDHTTQNKWWSVSDACQILLPCTPNVSQCY